MGGVKRMRVTGWVAAVIFLCLSALVCIFILKGYSFIGIGLVLIAGMISIYHLCSSQIWKASVIVIGAGLMLLTLIEIPIVAASKTDRDCKRDYLIVLGAEVVGNTPSRSLKYRIAEAKDYLDRYPESMVIVTGGQGEGENISEAQCMCENLVKLGVSPDRILQENKATSTMENLSFSYDLIRERGDSPDGNVAILSSSYHLFRAKQLSDKLGVDSAGVACYPGNPFLSANFFIREAFGVARLFVLGY